jgi:hypothetical protein
MPKTATPDSGRALTDRAYAAFSDVLLAGMQPTLSSVVQPSSNWRAGEYDVVVRGISHYGVLQEELQATLDIADRHDGRVWLSKDGELAILFEYPRAPGPDGEESPVEETRRKSRTKAAA